MVGYGAIGAAIEARLAPFEVEIVRVARSARAGVHSVDELPELLPDADVVILCLPLTDDSRGLVDAQFLARMRAGALLVNVARGAVVVTDDLVAALQTERVRAAIDVAEQEPLPAGQPAVDRARPADLSARGRRQQRDVAARAPGGPRPAAPLRPWRDAEQRRGSVVDSARGRPDP